MISSVDTLSRRIAGAGLDLSKRIPLPLHREYERRGRISDARASSTVSAKPARLCNTFFLAMPADEGLVALRKLGLERFALEFVTIPADGGCVVAVFSPSSQQVALISRFRLARDQQNVASLLASIGATVVVSHA